MEATVVLPKAIQAYFDTVNRKAFVETAELFAEEGKIIPPFDQPVEGRAAIATYLNQEASDMTFTPLECEAELECEAACKAEDHTDSPNSSDTESFIVKGKVKNSLFVVNVGWQFVLLKTGEIKSVKVKLLASLQELMKIRR